MPRGTRSELDRLPILPRFLYCCFFNWGEGWRLTIKPVDHFGNQLKPKRRLLSGSRSEWIPNGPRPAKPILRASNFIMVCIYVSVAVLILRALKSTTKSPGEPGQTSSTNSQISKPSVTHVIENPMASNPYVTPRWFCKECSRDFHSLKGANLHVQAVHTGEIIRDPKTGKWSRPKNYSNQLLLAAYIVGLMIITVLTYMAGRYGWFE
jgi:hypothetical protein